MRPSPNSRARRSAKQGFLLGLGAVLFSVMLMVPAAAQDSTPAETQASETNPSAEDFLKPMGPADPFNRGTPRGSLYGFVTACNSGDFEKAARFMDLRHLSPDGREAAGELARKLKVALNNQVWVDFADLSDEHSGFLDDGLPAWQDHVADLRSKEALVPFLMQRVPRTGDGVRIWKIAASTVGEGDGLYEELGPFWLEENLPSMFFEWTALGLALWQWGGLVALALASWLASLLFSGALVRILGKLFTRGDHDLDPRIVRVVRGPVRLAITVIVFGTWRPILALPVPASEFLRTVGHLLFVIAATWLVFRMIDLAVLQVRVRAEAHGRSGLLPVIQPVQVFAKVLIVAFGLLAVLGTFGVNVSALIAGLGVGGIAVALAAQKTLENLFGGVTLFADRPVRVGEYFKSGGVEGTVEEIGLRSTRIRTRDRTVVTIPNADFSNMALENFTRRDSIHLNTKFGLRYETTTDQLRYVIARLREILIAHPRVMDSPQRVRFVGIGAFTFDLEMRAYIDTQSFDEYLAIREDIYFRVVDAVRESGTNFAYPSSTLYAGPDPGINEADTESAESRVAEWRASGRLPFPEFSPEAYGELQNSFKWPPQRFPDDEDEQP